MLTARAGMAVVGAAATLLAAAPTAFADHPAAYDAFMSSALAPRSPMAAASTAAPQPQPLTGEGENMELVANVPIDPGTQGVAASDLELHGDYAFVGSYGEGMVVVDISQPRNPRRVGRFDCPGGQNDIQLSPDGNRAVMAIDTTSNKCHPGLEGTVVLDVSDPAKPAEIDFIPIAIGSHNNTLNWPILYVDNYLNNYSKLEIFDLSKPERGVQKKVGEVDFGAGQNSPHDLIVDHRRDGRKLAYAASISASDVIDVTDSSRPRLVQRIFDPAVSISHQAEPNFDRSLLLVTDEYQGGTSAPACGKAGATTVGAAGAIPAPVGDPADIGALHFYRLEPDGTIAGTNGQPKVATFNIPAQPNEDPAAGCTIHVFWQAPDQNRLVTAWYGRGTRIVDYQDPDDARQLAFFVPTGADTWSAKPHRGYIFAGDIVRGLDILRYTGEGGRAWPATAGPAEIQRAEESGQPPLASSGLQIASSRPRADRRGRVPVKLRCLAPAGCAGTVKLSAARGGKRKTIGRRGFKISGDGSRRRVTVWLSRTGLALLGAQRRGGLPVRVGARVRFGSAPAVSLERELRLRRAH